jgi:hypothetical protein
MFAIRPLREPLWIGGKLVIKKRSRVSSPARVKNYTFKNTKNPHTEGDHVWLMQAISDGITTLSITTLSIIITNMTIKN